MSANPKCPLCRKDHIIINIVPQQPQIVVVVPEKNMRFIRLTAAFVFCISAGYFMSNLK